MMMISKLGKIMRMLPKYMLRVSIKLSDMARMELSLSRASINQPKEKLPSRSSQKKI